MPFYVFHAPAPTIYIGKLPFQRSVHLQDVGMVIFYRFLDYFQIRRFQPLSPMALVCSCRRPSTLSRFVRFRFPASLRYPLILNGFGQYVFLII